MKNDNRKLINFTQISSYIAILITILIFIFEFSRIIDLGLGGAIAFVNSVAYIAPPAIVALILSFVFNKFKFNLKSFNKFWFWIMIITLISYSANSLSS